MTKLIVAERFYSLQCEGRAIGTPAVFLRLAGCNLLCESKTWRCDTIEVWQKGKAHDFADVLPAEYIDRLKRGAHLVITGGEPLLHQHKIVEYLSWLGLIHGLNPFVEIETNGTIKPIYELLTYVDWFNVSPKLSNSGEDKSKRINTDALFMLRRLDSIFKFVVSNDKDIDEMLHDYGQHVPLDKIFLMPAGGTQHELNCTRQFTAEACIRYGFKYSERLHIVIWNQKTGV